MAKVNNGDLIELQYKIENGKTERKYLEARIAVLCSELDTEKKFRQMYKDLYEKEARLRLDQSLEHNSLLKTLHKQEALINKLQLQHGELGNDNSKLQIPPRANIFPIFDKDKESLMIESGGEEKHNITTNSEMKTQSIRVKEHTPCPNPPAQTKPEKSTNNAQTLKTRTSRGTVNSKPKINSNPVPNPILKRQRSSTSKEDMLNVVKDLDPHVFADFTDSSDEEEPEKIAINKHENKNQVKKLREK